MGRKRKFEPLIVEKIVLEYINGKKGATQIENDYKIAAYTLYKWVREYKKYGIEGFKDSSSNRKYSKEFKLKVVEAYLKGEGNSIELAVKYDIRSSAQVRKWAKDYNIGKELKDY